MDKLPLCVWGCGGVILSPFVGDVDCVSCLSDSVGVLIVSSCPLSLPVHRQASL